MAGPDIKCQLAVVNEDTRNQYKDAHDTGAYVLQVTISICQTKSITCWECGINEQTLSEVGMCSKIEPVNE